MPKDEGSLPEKRSKNQSEWPISDLGFFLQKVNQFYQPQVCVLLLETTGTQPNFIWHEKRTVKWQKDIRLLMVKVAHWPVQINVEFYQQWRVAGRHRIGRLHVQMLLTTSLQGSTTEFSNCQVFLVSVN